MKKVIVILSVLMLLVFVSCGKNDDSMKTDEIISSKSDVSNNFDIDYLAENYVSTNNGYNKDFLYIIKSLNESKKEVLTMSDENQYEINVKAGEELTFIFQENITIAYAWALIMADNQDVITYESYHVYSVIQPEVDVVGENYDTRVFEVLVDQPGTLDLVFKYDHVLVEERKEEHSIVVNVVINVE